MYYPSPSLLKSSSLTSLNDNSLKFKVKNTKPDFLQNIMFFYLLIAPQGSRNALINCGILFMLQISQCLLSPDESPEASQCHI
jgi:hypothetical protein